jgi:hypothetical protein
MRARQAYFAQQGINVDAATSKATGVKGTASKVGGARPNPHDYGGDPYTNIGMMQEANERGFWSTVGNHALGAIPGFDVQARNYAPGTTFQGKNVAAPSVTDFSIGRGIADVAGFALGVPGAGDMYDTAADFIDSDETVSDRVASMLSSGGANPNQPTPYSPPPFSGGNEEPQGPYVPQPRPRPRPTQLAQAGLNTAGPVSPIGGEAGISGVQRRGERLSFEYGGVVPSSGDANMTNVDRLVAIATDPAYNSISPGVGSQGILGQPVTRQSFEAGGVIGGQPAGLNPQGNNGPIPAQMMEQEIQRIGAEHPEQVQQVKQAMDEAMQTGELTPQELNMITQLAQTAAQNPQMWPQLRQFAIQQGLATEQDISVEYDQGLVFILLMVAKTFQGGQAQQGVPQSDAQPPQINLEDGGMSGKSQHADKSIAANLHENEMVFSADASRYWGEKKLKQMLEEGNAGGKKSGQTASA